MLTLHLDGVHDRDDPIRRVLVRQNPWTKFDPEGLFMFGLYDNAGDYFGDVGSVFKGYGQAGGDFVGGIAHTVAHPIQTAQGVGTAVAHPVATAKAAGGAISETWNSGLQGQGRVVGNVLIAVGTAVAPFAEGGQAANVASKGEQLAQAANAESKAAVASELGTSAAQTVAKTEQAVAKATDAPATLTPKQQTAVTRINNAVDDHLTGSDISGAVADQMGSPIPKRTGGYWDHAKEVGDAMRGVRKNSEALKDVAHPEAQAARQKGLEAIKRAEDAIKGAGI